MALLNGVAQKAGESLADRVGRVGGFKEKALRPDRVDLVELRLRLGDICSVFCKAADDTPGRRGALR